jgi:hypothetical protein
MATIEELLKPISARKDPRSLLIKAQCAAGVTGEQVVNACPFGCLDENLDEHGYCCHLVGFTNDKKLMEPMVLDWRGKRVVQVPFHMDRGKKIPDLLPIPRGAKLVPIAISYRVYDPNGQDPDELPPDPRTLKKEPTKSE